MIKVRTLFSGIGSPEMALTALGIQHEVLDFCEIDKYAVKSYCAIHGTDESKNLKDITKVDETKLEHANLIVWGFPCQDLSVAGKMRGLTDENGNKTRSGLLYDALRILQATMPEYSVCENVKALVSKKFDKEFKQLLAELEFYGYNNYYKILNARDYGIPQNRERVFLVSIRKDVDDGTFKFPESIPLELRLKDMLEQEVDEKYYLSQKIQERFKANVHGNIVGSTIGEECTRRGERDVVYGTDSFIGCLNATDYKQPKQILEGMPIKTANSKGYDVAVDGDSINLQFPDSKTGRGRVGHQVAQTLETACNQGVLEQVGMLDMKDSEQVRRVYSVEGLCPTLNTMQGGHRQPKIVAMRGRYNEDGTTSQQLEPRQDGCTNTITTVQKDNLVENNYRIRKLTPLECWRLMGFSDEDFYKAKAVNSDTQLYKQAGNSIVKQVLMAIFKNLLR